MTRDVKKIQQFSHKQTQQQSPPASHLVCHILKSFQAHSRFELHSNPLWALRTRQHPITYHKGASTSANKDQTTITLPMTTLNPKLNASRPLRHPATTTLNDENARLLIQETLMIKKNASTITRLPVAAPNKTLVHQSTAMAVRAGAKRSAFADVGNVNVKLDKENKNSKDLPPPKSLTSVAIAKPPSVTTAIKPSSVTTTARPPSVTTTAKPPSVSNAAKPPSVTTTTKPLTAPHPLPLRTKTAAPTRLKITATKSNTAKSTATYPKSRPAVGTSRATMIIAPSASTAGVAGAKVQKSKASAVAVAAAAVLTGSHHRHVVAAPVQAARQHARIPPVVVEAGRTCAEEKVREDEAATGRNDEKHMARRRKKGENMELDGEEDKENMVAVDNSGMVASLEILAADVKRPQTKRKVMVETIAERAEVVAERAEEEAAKKEFEEFEDESELDINMVSEYSKEIFEYMKELEVRLKPDPNYMDHQEEIEWHMRSILVDWLVQVHARFRLLPETLFLCVHLIDRFLTIKSVGLQKLQLVGAGALFIAAKFEEIQCPSVTEIIFMLDNGYSAEELLRAERYMLNQLGFELGWPGPMSWLRRCSRGDKFDLQTRTLAKYLIEMTLLDERFLRWPTSQVAAAGHCLSRILLQKGDWTKAHAYFSGYVESDLQPLVRILLQLLTAPQRYPAIYEKYADKRYMRASVFVEQYLAKNQTEVARAVAVMGTSC